MAYPTTRQDRFTRPGKKPSATRPYRRPGGTDLPGRQPGIPSVPTLPKPPGAPSPLDRYRTKSPLMGGVAPPPKLPPPPEKAGRGLADLPPAPIGAPTLPKVGERPMKRPGAPPAVPAPAAVPAAAPAAAPAPQVAPPEEVDRWRSVLGLFPGVQFADRTPQSFLDQLSLTGLGGAETYPLYQAIESGLLDDPDVVAFLQSASAENRFDALQDLLSMSDLKNQFGAENPAYAALIGDIGVLEFGGILDQIIAFRYPNVSSERGDLAERLAATELGQMATAFGDAIFMATPETLNQVLGIIGEGGSVAALTPQQRSEINTLLSEDRARQQAEEDKEAVADLAYGWIEELQGLKGELWTPQDQAFEDRLQQYAMGEIQPISDEYVDRAITMMDRIINRTFGTEAAYRGTLGGARGQAGSAFAAQMSQQLQARALDAKVGARFKALNFQEETNARLQKEYMGLYALTGDARRSALLTAERITGDAIRLVTAIETGTVTMPMDYTDWGFMAQAMESLLEADKEFDATQLDWAGDPLGSLGTFVMGLAGTVVPWAASYFGTGQLFDLD